MRRLLRLAVAVWLLRWAAGELAAYAGRHWRKHGPPPRESSVVPGLMPLPSDEALRKQAQP